MTTVRSIPETFESNLFQLGKIVITPGVQVRCSPDEIKACLKQHKDGFRTWVWETRWLYAEPEPLIDGHYFSDVFLNGRCEDEAIVWLITHADRSVTLVLLPCEA